MNKKIRRFRRETARKQLLQQFNDPVLVVTICFALAVVFFFVILPMLNILKTSLYFDKILSSANYLNIFNSINAKIILNTLLLGVCSGLISTGLGFLFAYGVSYLRLPLRRFFKIFAVLPIISPPFVLALSIILTFGRSGLVTRHLLGMTNANIYGFHGLLLVQIMTYFPIAYLLMVGLLEGIDPSVEEAARNMGASRGQVFRTVTLPLMIPGLANAFLLIFTQSIADFGNPLIIGGNFTTVAVQIYLQGIGNYDMGSATALAMVLLSISVSVFAIQKYYVSRKSYITITGKTAKQRRLIEEKSITRPVFLAMLFVSIFVLFHYLLIPFGSFIQLWGYDFSPTLKHYAYVKELGLKVFSDTTGLALISAPLAGILAMLIGFLLVRKVFIGKNFLEFSSLMGLAIPGTIIGLGYVLTYNNPPLILTNTALILIIAFVMRSMPVGIRSAVAALQQIDPAIEEAASVSGASSRKVFTSVTLPLIRPAFFGGLVYAFVRSMTLVSTVIFLVSANYNLLTVSVMNQIEQGRIGVASAYCSILIAIVTVTILLIKGLLSRMGIKNIAEA